MECVNTLNKSLSVEFFILVLKFKQIFDLKKTAIWKHLAHTDTHLLDDTHLLGVLFHSVYVVSSPQMHTDNRINQKTF